MIALLGSTGTGRSGLAFHPNEPGPRPRHHLTTPTAPAPPHRPRRRAIAASSSSSPLQPLEAALEAALAECTPDQRLLPAWDEATSRAKRRCIEAAEALERVGAAAALQGAPPPSPSLPSPPLPSLRPPLLEGEWDLALAGSGTVVTRTPLVRALSALSRGSDSYGLGRIRQVLSAAPSGGGSSGAGDVCVAASNEAELLLGPLLGKWRVAVRGAWRRPRLAVGGGGASGSSSGTTTANSPQPLLPGALVVDVAFDELLIGPVGGGGPGHDGEDDAKEEEEDRRALRLPLPRRVRSAARRGSGGGAGSVEWATTYVGERWRIGRGVRSSNLFVFRRRGS